MKRTCTNCGADFDAGSTKRRTCSEQCARARRSAGGLTTKARDNRELGPQAPRTGRGAGYASGAGRSVMIGGQLQVVDPVVLADRGVRLAERRGLEWTEWIPL